MAPLSLPELARLARLAEVAYLDPTPCMEAVRVISGSITCLDDTETQCGVSFFADRQVVAFRGTEPAKLADWLTDARCYLRRWAGRGRVHTGFDAGLALVYDQILAVLAPGLPVYATGHSLGGALATLFAARLELQTPGRVAGGLTCGSPRPGGWKFARWFNEVFGDRWTRAIHDDDMVTWVPGVLAGYHHVGGRAAWINREGTGISWDPALPIHPATLPDCLDDHHVAQYSSAFARIAEAC